MIFTKEEKAKLIKNCRDVINYIKTEICPNLRSGVNFTFEVSPRTKDLRVHIYSDGTMSIARSEQYSFKPVENNQYRNFFYEENSEVQIVFLKNWPYMKERLFRQIEEDKNTIEFLNDFSV